MGIGRVIYRHSAMTSVRPAQECVSACVFILMAGAIHTPSGAAIGVHKPMLVAWHNMSAAEARAKYDGLMRYLRIYFRELGVADEAYDIMMNTSYTDMHYFTWWEMDRLGLRGEGPAWRARFAERQAVTALQEALRLEREALDAYAAAIGQLGEEPLTRDTAMSFLSAHERHFEDLARRLRLLGVRAVPELDELGSADEPRRLVPPSTQAAMA